MLRLLALVLAVLAACGDVAPQRDVSCGAQPIEVLPNGSFDQPTPPWVQDPPSPPLLCGAPTITPADGMLAGCLGATDGTVKTLSQQVPLPAGATTATLSGQICITTAETAAMDNDILTFTLLDGGNTVAALGQFSNQQGVAACSFMPFSLPAVKLMSDPATATLQLKSTLNADNPTSFFVDALSLKISCN